MKPGGLMCVAADVRSTPTNGPYYALEPEGNAKQEQ
jgi:hypothetical protein